MFWEYKSFWIFVSVSIGVCTIIFAFTCKQWSNKSDKIIHGEALRSPTNAGVTAAAFLIPLLLSLLSYLLFSLKLEFRHLTYPSGQVHLADNE